MNVPLRLGDRATFARVRALFERMAFRPETICRGLGIQNISQVGKAAPEGIDFSAALGSEVLGVLVRVFVFTQTVPREAIERALNPSDLAALLALDLLRLGPEAYYSTAFVYPVAGCVIASDRHDSPDGSTIELASDVVFPALDAGTLRFLGLIPLSHVDDALDLCSGTGIAALVLSRSADRVVAADITSRAAHFAQFNILLNDCPNVVAAVGDLYEAVRGQAFDRIVAHPPYVPALEQARIFRDGGETGEHVLRRIIADLPRYLRPGGSFVCVSAAWDSTEGPLESRLRGWLGAYEGEFDVIFAQQEEVAPQRLARWLAEKGGDLTLRARWEREFKDAGLERNVYGAIVLQRIGGGAERRGPAPVTARPRLSPRTDGACLEWALRWYRWRAQQESRGTLSQALFDARPSLGSRLRARVTFAPGSGGLDVTDIVLQADRPFRSSTGIERWMLGLIAGFGQGRTAREVYDVALAAGQLPAGFGPDDFVTLVAMMVERGYLEVEDSLLSP